MTKTMILEQMQRAIEAAVEKAVAEEVDKAIKQVEFEIRGKVPQIAVRIFQRCSMEKYAVDQLVIKFDLENKKL